MSLMKLFIIPMALLEIRRQAVNGIAVDCGTVAAMVSIAAGTGGIVKLQKTKKR